MDFLFFYPILSKETRARSSFNPILVGALRTSLEADAWALPATVFRKSHLSVPLSMPNSNGLVCLISCPTEGVSAIEGASFVL